MEIVDLQNLGQVADDMSIEHFGSAKISPNGQAGIPVGLRRALGIDNESRPVQVFADLERREIHLIADVDAEKLYELMRRLNRVSERGPEERRKASP